MCNNMWILTAFSTQDVVGIIKIVLTISKIGLIIPNGETRAEALRSQRRLRQAQGLTREWGNQRVLEAPH